MAARDQNPARPGSAARPGRRRRLDRLLQGAAPGPGPPVPFLSVCKGRCTNPGVKQGRVCFVAPQPSISAQRSAVGSVTRPRHPRCSWDKPGSYQVGLPAVVGRYVRRGKKSRMLNRNKLLCWGAAGRCLVLFQSVGGPVFNREEKNLQLWCSYRNFFPRYLFLKGSEITRNGSKGNDFLSQHLWRGRMSSNVSSLATVLGSDFQQTEIGVSQCFWAVVSVLF